MTNVKNITDLPIAESSDGLNLIVSDGGSAKQIAASAVGAQADWNVIDEASPAFIKNKPETAQADWEIEDETNAAFIKNKPMTGYMIKPTAAEITVNDTTFICTTNYDELAKALEKGINACVRIPMSVLAPEVAEEIPYFVVIITSWGYVPQQGVGCHGTIQLGGETISGLFVFTNGTYVPNLE